MTTKDVEKEVKQRLNLKDPSTHLLPTLTAANRPIIKGGWQSNDLHDVRRLLEKKIPVSCSGMEHGLFTVGFNCKLEKYVGVGWLHKAVVENPLFDSMQDALDWFMKKVELVENDE